VGNSALYSSSHRPVPCIPVVCCRSLIHILAPYTRRPSPYTYTHPLYSVYTKGMVFEIKTPIFEGPLHLLLSLVEKRQLLINEISLTKVTDEFISYINSSANATTSESAEFILVAATLVLIKSKSLLPAIELTSGESADIEMLEHRLKMLKTVREMAGFLKHHLAGPLIFLANDRPFTPIFSPEEDLKYESLKNAMKELLASLPKKEAVPTAVVQKVVSLQEMIEDLTERVQRGLKMSFRQFSKNHAESKVGLIVSFLALLELVKRGIVSVSQNDTFDDILIETENLGTPNYL